MDEVNPRIRGLIPVAKGSGLSIGFAKDCGNHGFNDRMLPSLQEPHLQQDVQEAAESAGMARSNSSCARLACSQMIPLYLEKEKLQLQADQFSADVMTFPLQLLLLFPGS